MDHFARRQASRHHHPAHAAVQYGLWRKRWQDVVRYGAEGNLSNAHKNCWQAPIASNIDLTLSSIDTHKMNLSLALKAAENAARRGGEIAREGLGKLGYIKWKGLSDPMPEAAMAIQQAMCAELAAAFRG